MDLLGHLKSIKEFYFCHTRPVHFCFHDAGSLRGFLSSKQTFLF
ncbi:conserved hypothetical protein [delta proteobacterium NaphS2]|nr:conserved hypothetical protein [delta proteobacterium NaphS2]